MVPDIKNTLFSYALENFMLAAVAHTRNPSSGKSDGGKRRAAGATKQNCLKYMHSYKVNGSRMELSGRALPSTLQPWVPSPASHKPGMVVLICNPRTQEVEARARWRGGIRNSGSSWVTIEFKTNLGYLRSCLQINKQLY